MRFDLAAAADPHRRVEGDIAAVIEFTRGTDNSAQLVATGGAIPHRWSTSDVLPEGVEMALDGRLSGFVSVSGTWYPRVTVTDATGRSYAAIVQLTIT